MNKPETVKIQTPSSLNQFFSAAEARIDRWRTLNRIAKALAAAGTSGAEALRTEVKAVMDEIAPLEELNGYPGPHLMAQVLERLKSGDWTGLARLVLRISNALLTNSYREDAEAWNAEEEGDAQLPDFLPPAV